MCNLYSKIIINVNCNWLHQSISDTFNCFVSLQHFKVTEPISKCVNTFLSVEKLSMTQSHNKGKSDLRDKGEFFIYGLLVVFNKICY